MSVDLEIAFAEALRTARSFLAFATHAEATGVLPEALTASMAHNVKESAARLEQAIAAGVPTPSPLLVSVIGHGVIDLGTLVELSELLHKYDVTPRNVLHLAGALRYTAEKAVRTLASVEHGLRRR